MLADALAGVSPLIAVLVILAIIALLIFIIKR
jgi:hypothetical protein